MRAHVLEARLRRKLGHAKMLVPQLCLHLAHRHPRLSQQDGHTCPEPGWGDVLPQASALRRVVDPELDSTWGRAGMAGALAQGERLPPMQRGPQLLS
jgi:hypothetical protein